MLCLCEGSPCFVLFYILKFLNKMLKGNDAVEEMQIQQWQWPQGVQGLAPPAPAKPDPWVPPAPVVGPQPGTAPCTLRSPWQRLWGLGAGHCPHTDLFLSRGRCLSTRTAMGAEVSAALCHHRVWTWLSFIISHLPVKGPNVKSAGEQAGWEPFGEWVAPRFLPCDSLRCCPPTSPLPRSQGFGWSRAGRTDANVPQTLLSASHAREVEARAPHAPPSSNPASACAARKAISGAQAARPKPHRRQRPRETKAPKEIPPEAVREYMDIMDGLVGPAHSASGEEDRKAPQQEEDGDHLDQGLLSYIDELCSQEDFVTKVGWLGAPGSGRFQGVAL